MSVDPYIIMKTILVSVFLIFAGYWFIRGSINVKRVLINFINDVLDTTAEKLKNNSIMTFIYTLYRIFFFSMGVGGILLGIYLLIGLAAKLLGYTLPNPFSIFSV